MYTNGLIGTRIIGRSTESDRSSGVTVDRRCAVHIIRQTDNRSGRHTNTHTRTHTYTHKTHKIDTKQCLSQRLESEVHW